MIHDEQAARPAVARSAPGMVVRLDPAGLVAARRRTLNAPLTSIFLLLVLVLAFSFALRFRLA
jgi:hypothetical protein